MLSVPRREMFDLAEMVGVREGERVLDVGHLTVSSSTLSYPDAAFDVVLCRQALQLVPQRPETLREMARVLAREGRLGVSVWGAIERNPAAVALAETLERLVGVRAAAAVRCLHTLSEPEVLRAVLTEAGFERTTVRSVRSFGRFPSVAGFVRASLPGSPIVSPATEAPREQRQEIVAELERELGSFMGSAGFTCPIQVIVGIAMR